MSPDAGTAIRPGPSRRLAALVVVVACIGVGYDQTAASATPSTIALANQAPLSGYPVGIMLSDGAYLTFGVNPTGTITFRAFPPGDPTCASPPVFVGNTAVAGNGRYVSTYYTTTLAGVYRWTAAYSGDANNNPVATSCGSATAAVTVTKRRPTLRSSATVSGAGTTSTDTGVLSGHVPTGTMTFSVYGPDDPACGGETVYTSTQTVTGNGSYTSGSFVAAVAGTYVWVVGYGGDSNNVAVSAACAETANVVTLTGA